MPAGRFPALKAESLDVNHLMDLRKQYDVSTEALFLRTVRLTDADCLMFTASRTEDHGRAGIYRIDYFIPSRNSSLEITRGMQLPNNSAVSECTAVGFTAKGQESWPESGGVRLECVGVPPYPGHSYPRVVGLIFPLEVSLGRSSEIKYLRGDALQPRGNGLNIVGHVVNDRTPNWGGGFALAVRKRFEAVQRDFQDWIQVERGKLELGEVRFAKATDHLMVASMIAQHGYGPSPTPRIRYNALSQCLEKLAQRAVQTGASVHLPRIGAGNASGDWSLIATLIDEMVCSKKVDVTVYDLPDQPKPLEGLFGR
jgi:O-acetyl-ADP-ribose deacetylase (regulator of RNase III)